MKVNKAEIGRNKHFCGGHYYLKQYRTGIIWIRERYRAGKSVDSLSKDYEIPKSVIMAAIKWRSGK